MPNIKSAMERVKTSKKANIRNRAVKSVIKTAVKKYDTAVIEDVKAAETALPEVQATLDKAAAKGVIHKNAANRRKATAAKKLAAAKQA